MQKIKQFLQKNWWVIGGVILGGFFIITQTAVPSEVIEEDGRNEVLPFAESISFGSWTPNGVRAIVGTTASESDIDVTAELTGKISRVHVDMGDTIQAGQALATFDIRGDQTYVNYQNAINNLETTKNSSQASIETSRLAVNNAQKEYEQLLLQLEQNKKTTVEGLKNTVNSTATVGLNVLNYFDGQIGASKKYDDQFAIGRGSIGRSNQILKIQVQNEIRALRIIYDKLKIKSIPSQENQLILLATEYLNFFESLKKTAKNYNTLIQGTVVTSEFSNIQKQQIATQTEGQNTQLDQAITRLNSQIQAVKNIDEQNKNQILSAKNRIESANANLELSQSQSEGQVKSAQNSVNLAASQKSDLIVRAPFSGKITEKFVRSGQFVSPGLKLFSMINLNKEKKAIAFLSPTEITRLKTQKTIKIQYEEQIIETTNFIEGLTINPQTQKIRVDFIFPKGTDIIPGKTVKILLSTKGLSNLIPISAISFEPNGTQEVLVVEKDGTLRRQIVEIKNDLSDGIIITSGLVENDQVIKYKSRFYSEQKVQINKNSN